jgi:hypothetical protein
MLTLSAETVPERTRRWGNGTFSVLPETDFEIRIKPKNGPWESLCEAQVPAGKEWRLWITLECNETNVP